MSSRTPYEYGSEEGMKPSPMQTFDRVEWMKKHVLPGKLVDGTVGLKYLIHPSEINEHLAIEKVFSRFDSNGNSIALFRTC